MDLGIITVVHSGYSVYLDRWVDSISKMNPQPSMVTIAAGHGSGVSKKQLLLHKKRLPQLRVVGCGSTVLGTLRNAAVEATDTEWLMVLDVDDIIYPQAIPIFESVAERSDAILISWNEIKDGNTRKRTQTHPARAAKTNEGRFFFHNATPFKRTFWENTPFDDNNYPGLKFVVDLVEAEAAFNTTNEASCAHIRHNDSFSHRSRRSAEVREFVQKIRAEQARRLVALYERQRHGHRDSNGSV